jgi:hypothetical protein
MAMQEQVERFEANRHAVLIEVFAERRGLFHRKLSPELKMSRQPLDRLARIVSAPARA